eukprot:4230166-Pyramimonas_sp.AAC.1
MPVLELVFSARPAARISRLGLRHRCRVLSVTLGLPVSCGLADDAARAFIITECGLAIQRNPRVYPMSYVDDAGAHVSGRDRDLVIGVAAAARTEFQELPERLQATLNDKVAITASDAQIGQAVAEQMRRQGQVQNGSLLLGCGFRWWSPPCPS